MTETEAILSVQPILRQIVNRFAYKFHLDADELFQEVQLVALEGVRSHKPAKRTLCSWVHFLVTQSLYSRVRFPGFRNRFGFTSNVELDSLEERHSFRLEMLLIDVSEDAAEAIQIALYEGVADRSYLESILFFSFNWTEEKITKTFREIQEALR